MFRIKNAYPTQPLPRGKELNSPLPEGEGPGVRAAGQVEQGLNLIYHAPVQEILEYVKKKGLSFYY
jgi:hypothetical protein